MKKPLTTGDVSGKLNDKRLERVLKALSCHVSASEAEVVTDINMVTDSRRTSKPRHKTKRLAVDRPAKKTVKTKATLVRTTFTTSREMDFFSEKELTTQTGHSIDEWYLVFVKEAMDNALDATNRVLRP